MSDLISREALKKALNEMFDTVEVMLFDDIIATIDNAQPASDRYDEGYAQGYIDGSTGAEMKGGAENVKQ